MLWRYVFSFLIFHEFNVKCSSKIIKIQNCYFSGIFEFQTLIWNFDPLKWTKIKIWMISKHRNGDLASSNGFQRLTSIDVISQETQCENLRIFLPLRFYVKPISVTLKLENYSFHNFRSSEFWFFVTFCNYSRQKFTKTKNQGTYNCQNRQI